MVHQKIDYLGEDIIDILTPNFYYHNQRIHDYFTDNNYGLPLKNILNMK